MNISDFPMLSQDLIYFDNGATTLKPKCVIDKINDYYTNYSVSAHRGDYDLAYRVNTEYEQVREKVQKFINAKDLESIVFTSGSTESLNMIANGFFKNYLESGDEVLITTSEHASNVLPWFHLENTIGIKVKYIPLDDHHYVTLDNVKKVITSKTKVIALAGVTNVIGDLRPIKEITSLAHANNIFVVMDGAQYVPHFKTDVEDLDVDFLAFSAHKMCGPTGLGILYGKKELLEEMEPVRFGGGMNESFDTPSELYFKELPHRLEGGTPHVAGVLGFGCAIDYLSSIGMDKISEYERHLRSYAMEKLLKIPYLDILNIESDAGIIAFNVDDIFSQDVAYYLNKYNICVRAGSHCAKNLKSETGVKNSVRISFYFYNTESEIDDLVELLSNKEKMRIEMI